MSDDKQIYDLPKHTVTVTEINSVDLTNAGGAYLGMNVVSCDCGCCNDALYGKQCSVIDFVRCFIISDKGN